jgi:hypothetical protein
MDRLLFVTALFSIGVIVMVLGSVRRAHIRVEYSVSWLIAASVLLVLSLNRNLVVWLASLLGVDYAPIAVLLIAFAIFVLVFYRLSMRVSDLKDANIALAQRVAILEYQLKSAHEEREGSQERRQEI